MIPPSYFVHVIQSEREQDLQRWRRIHEARAAAHSREGIGRVARLLATIDRRARGARPASVTIACDGSIAPAACCS